MPATRVDKLPAHMMAPKSRQSMLAHLRNNARPEEARQAVTLVPVLGEVVWHSERPDGSGLHLVVLHVRRAQNVWGEPPRESCSETWSAISG